VKRKLIYFEKDKYWSLGARFHLVDRQTIFAKIKEGKSNPIRKKKLVRL